MPDHQNRSGSRGLRRSPPFACAFSEAGRHDDRGRLAALIVALIAAAVFTGLRPPRTSRAPAPPVGRDRTGPAATSSASAASRSRSLSRPRRAAAVSPHRRTGTGATRRRSTTRRTRSTQPPQFYSASSASQSCTTSGVGSADYVATTSKVTWQNSNDSRQPVEDHSLITPATGGQIVVAVQDSVGSSTAGLAGATVTITGPGTSTATQSAMTDGNGCALFVAITAGSYNVSATIPSPYVSYGGTTTQSVQVANSETQTVPFNVARAATLNTSFQTTVNGTTSAIPFDTFSLAATSESAAQSFGTAGTYATPPSTVSSGRNALSVSSGYDAYAGTCTADDPGSSHDTSVTVTDGGTTAATVSVPSMLLALSTQSSSGGIFNDNSSQVSYTGSWGYSIGQSWNNSPPYPGDYNDDEHASNTPGSTASFTFTGTSVEWITSLDSTKGEADVYIDGARSPRTSICTARGA